MDKNKKNYSILIVEDEAPIREMIHFALYHKFALEEAVSVAAAKLKIASRIPDLILLDWMLPDKSGIEFLKELKSDKLTREIPVIILTAKAEEANKIRGLETGADDYITKPFSVKELIVRIETILRRSGTVFTLDNILSVANLTINLISKEVLIAGKPLQLTKKEFRLLHFLAKHPNRVYSRDELLTRIWDSSENVTDRTVDALVKRLRQKMANSSSLIQTSHGEGYYFSIK
jgi:two-component system phosphate regulon response regulator PhoB